MKVFIVLGRTALPVNRMLLCDLPLMIRTGSCECDGQEEEEHVFTSVVQQRVANGRTELGCGDKE